MKDDEHGYVRMNKLDFVNIFRERFKMSQISFTFIGVHSSFGGKEKKIPETKSFNLDLF